MKITDLIIPLYEAVEVTDVDLFAYAVVVAEAFDSAPQNDPSAEQAYAALVESNQKLYQRLTAKTNVQFTQDDPYKTATQMTRDVAQNKQLRVYTGGDDHPMMSPEQNNIFRTVHDYYAHAGANRSAVAGGGKSRSHSFLYRGELNAYLVHAKLAPRQAIPALFTEVVGQASYFAVTNNFSEQKAVVLDGFDYQRIGKVSGQHQNRFREVQQQLRDSNQQQIDLNIRGLPRIQKSEINWKLISPSARAGKIQKTQ